MSRRELVSWLTIFVVLSACVAGALDDKPKAKESDARKHSNASLPPEQSLELSTTAVASTVLANGTFGGIHCAAGGVYIRPLSISESAYKSPIVRISKDGQSTVFDARRIPDLPPKYDVYAYDVDHDGRLHELVKARQGSSSFLYLVSFARDGSFAWKHSVDSSLVPMRLKVLGDNQFLVLASTEPNNVKDSQLLVIDDSGGVKRTLPLPAGSGQSMVGPDVIVGRDQNLYVLEPSSPAVVRVYDYSGQLIRTTPLTDPFKDAQATGMVEDSRQIAVTYQSKDSLKGSGEFKLVYAIYDLQEGGVPVKIYKWVKAIPACIQGQSFTFVTTQNGRFAVAEAPLSK